MVKPKSNRNYLLLICVLINTIACSNKNENNISNVLFGRDIRWVASNKYESRAIGEWYVLERYTLSQDTTILLDINRDNKEGHIERHPTLDKYYWIGWNPVSVHSSVYDILLESTRFYTTDSLVQAYEICCHSGTAYFTIMIRDSMDLYNELSEKTAVVFDSKANTLYICNYHY
ncbi:MAG: hypothetical protein MST03_03350 [Bacteroidales bacterium]|nr:hypothetical protein [Bacteroidales bacterium]